MKKYIAVFRDIELDVYAETQKDARKRALEGFLSQLEKELKVRENERTEPCDGCGYACAPSMIIVEDNEQLCFSCYGNKYRFEDFNLNDIDIPF